MLCMKGAVPSQRHGQGGEGDPDAIEADTTAAAPPILSLRFSSPSLPPGFVARPRTDEILDSARGGDVTLVCAAAGYGKTLAVAAWAQGAHRRDRIAWLAAGEGAGVAAFWHDVISALRMLPVVADEARVTEFMPGPAFGNSDVAGLVDALSFLPEPVTLVIDDFQRLTSADVLKSIHLVLECGVPTVHLVLISRVEPRIPLRRLQVMGRLREIDAAVLAFTPAEADELCARIGVEVDAKSRGRLMDRTQGWPAGIRLALLSATVEYGGDVHAALMGFGGSGTLVASYLLEEVLARVATSDREFLLATSVPPVVCADLAHELTGRADSFAILEQLVTRNVLTVRLPGRSGWFRYHPLLREFLRDRLTIEHPQEISTLHRRTARWYLENGELIPGIRHLVAAGDWLTVAEVVGKSALPLILTIHAGELAAALAPALDVVERDPRPEVLLAACVVAHHSRDFVTMRQNALDAETALLGSGVEPPRWAQIIVALARMVAARVFIPVELYETANEVLAVATGASRNELPAVGAYAVIGRTNVAISLVLRGEFDRARVHLEDVRVEADRARVALTSAAAHAYLALLDVIAGDLPEAGRRSDMLARLGVRRGWTQQPQLLAANAASALVHLETDELDAASECIDSGFDLVLHGSDLPATVVLQIAAVGVALARRELHTARAAASRLSALSASCTGLPLLDHWVAVSLARVELLCDDVDSAEKILTGLPASTSSSSREFSAELVAIARAEVLLAQHEPRAAFDLLGTPSRYAAHRTLVVEAALLSAIAADRLRLDSIALERIGQAIDAAAPIGALRPFVAHSEEITGLLASYRHLNAEPSELNRALLVRLTAADGAATIRPATPSTPLTERELAVLRYLPTMYKSAEIAANLYVSVNTVKTHQQSIYRKLGVSTRRAAVDRAREWRLL
ncbi:putative LuxR family transcriptional regulator [Gordonia sputi NBRC 100414]|uniref:Putative LuxR family transcriptional regulator n=2 Tax=Gordonia sputi TaxID=36823 RepID=H5U7K2_9ACTN|nr:putative LuxR family transcriptional regulator [Gordonia sputi NBRC 100414]